MKPILVLFFILTFTPCFSQSAPDFTFTDTEGKQWNLYTELGKGKTVLLDFFFADCTPCQTLTPGIVQLNNDYGSGTDNLIVFGISDRDDNEKVEQFENDYGVNYPSCGLTGGGDTITNLYVSWFSFIGWPTYAVVCPDKSVSWNLPKNSGFPEIRTAIDECNALTAIITATHSYSTYQIYPVPSTDQLNIKSNQTGPAEIFLYEPISGKNVIYKEIYFSGETLSVSLKELNAGLYTLLINSKSKQSIFKVPVIK